MFKLIGALFLVSAAAQEATAVAHKRNTRLDKVGTRIAGLDSTPAIESAKSRTRFYVAGMAIVGAIAGVCIANIVEGAE